MLRHRDALRLAIFTALGAFVSLGANKPATAQGQPPGDPLPKPRSTVRQSQVNPAAQTHGDTTNRGRMSGDFLWGATNANRTFDRPVYGRVPDLTEDSPLVLDGFTFPYPIANGRRVKTDGAGSTAALLNPPLVIDNESTPLLVTNPAFPVTGVGPGALGSQGGFTVGALWASLTGPSANYIGGGYHATPAIARPAAALANPADPTRDNIFAWYPNVPGTPGQVGRYAIRVHIPEPDPADPATEARVTDARYIVYYAVPLGNNRFVRKSKVVFLSQDTAGDKWLVGEDNNPAVFPFLSEATYSSGATQGIPYYLDSAGLTLGDPRARARVELDNSTEGETDSHVVIADRIEFVQRTATVQGSPVVTPPHGGRKVDTTQAKPVVEPDADPYDQPGAGANYGLNIGSVLGNLVFLNDSFSFINNPRDPAYTTVGDPLEGKFDPANPSVLFRGPASLIDPRNALNVPVAGIDAVNHQQYRNGVDPVPYFSHMQVLISRTEFVIDPESGVPDGEKDGTKTLEVGCLYALDWATGTPIWRWPDKSLLPALSGGAVWRHPGTGAPVVGAALRNPLIATSPNVNQISGIGAIDKNGDGLYQDDEIYIVGQGNNPNGGFKAGATITPNISVLGSVLVPGYTDLGGGAYEMSAAVTAPGGRYYRPNPNPLDPNKWLPVTMPVAFVGSNNGVLYAIDPFGNNDNQYIENAADKTRLGIFRPGTTNILWTFSPQSQARVLTGVNAERLDKYYQRLKGEIPVPEGFGAAAPVVAWAKQSDDPTFDPTTEEPRLFAGNQNKVLYALDPRANAGLDTISGDPRPLPIRKGEQVRHTIAALNNNIPEPLVQNYRKDLKWWFETLGPINATPAISDAAFLRNAGALPVTASRRVYVTTGEGRVYSLDWDGPVTKMDHERNLVWDGTDGVNLDPLVSVPSTRPVNAQSAAGLNDNVRFHNDLPARPNARPDLTEGTLRPVWAFPNRYADIRDTGIASAVDNRIGVDLPDSSLAYGGATRLAVPFTNVGPIYSAPVVMDIAMADRDTAISGLTGIRHYLVVATNDYNQDEPNSPKQGRLFLLDQEGDRNDFLTNPMPTKSTAKFTPSDPAVNTARVLGGATAKPTPAAGATIYSQPLDQYVNKTGPFGQATPAWTYRFVYDTYDVSNRPIIARRARPTTVALPEPVDGNPARRTLPTIFFGGVGKLFALDLDDETGLFLRWRREDLAQPNRNQPTPLPGDDSVLVPGDEGQADRLNPQDTLNPASPILNVGNQNTLGLASKRILARVVGLRGDGSSVDGQIVITGGPLQNRNNTTAPTVAVALPSTLPPASGVDKPTVPLVPTLDAPLTRSILTLEPTKDIPNPPMLPIPYNLNPFGYDLDLTASLGTVSGVPTALFLPIIDLTGRYVNQDIGDPLATSRGTWNFLDAPTPVTPVNNAYQYPTLLVTTAQGALYEVSTNIEGEDPSAATSSEIPDAGLDGNRFAALGWAFADGDQTRFNDLHVWFFSKVGPGGSGAGISVVTNAYFPALDSDYARREDHLTKQAGSASESYIYYPKDEPQALLSSYGDERRPAFLPRPLYQGNAADGLATPPITTVNPDYHTGQTGFPLDLNGLFYDKRYAPATGTNHNADGKIKLPAYDQQGNRSVAPPTTGAPESDRERYDHTLANTTVVNDNAAGQNATWIYVAGEDGIFYAYTPVFSPALGGVASGFAGGIDKRGLGGFFGIPGGGPGGGGGAGTAGITAQPRVDIFTKTDFDALLAAARSGNPERPDRDGTEATWVNAQETAIAGRNVTVNRRSVAALGGKNFYEWGETINIVAWDLTVLASQRSAGVLTVPSTAQVTLVFKPRSGGREVSLTVNLERATAGPSAGLVSTYPMVPRYRIPSANWAPGTIPARLGLAFRSIRLTASSGSGVALTPGVIYEVEARFNTTNPILGLNPNSIVVATQTNGLDSQQRAFLLPHLLIANPLAVQGFLTDTATGAPVLPNKAAGDPVAGGIGPFLTPPVDNQLHAFRNRVATGIPDDTMDPDRASYEYSQALSNGNEITRYDYNPYRTVSGRLRINPGFGQPLRRADGDDPTFYIPVVTSTGYIGHGRTGSTDLSNRQRNLRILNRSTLGSLNVRAEVMDDLIWRWWPGRIPNEDLDLDGSGNGNLPITPAGMRHDGRVNPLPWETEVPLAQPWKRRTSTTIVGLGNISPDYPDVVAASRAQQGRQSVSVTLGGTDLVQGSASLVNAQLAVTPNPANAVRPYMDPTQTGYNLFSAAVGVRMPQFQPANLVANHNLTSTYESPSTADGAQPFIGDGKVQLPRGIANRNLHVYNPGTGLFDGNQTITPFGYTTRIKIYVDAGQPGTADNRQWDPGEPYRIVEVWTGVPVDMGLKSNESPVDLGALPAGFAQQNGLMGYLNGGTNNPGFLPDPIGRLGVGAVAPYDSFFKKLTIQNTGNVNLYNLRAGQRFESLTTPTGAINNQFGTGNYFWYFGLTSATVDPRFGILSVGADPALTANATFTPANIMPQVVTSLDRQFDAAWDAYYQTVPWLNQHIDNGSGGVTTPYLRYYQMLGGRHPLHKARPGSADPAVLSLPDVPVATALVPVISPVQPVLNLPTIGISVPVGTPVGVYRSNTVNGSNGLPPQLAVYEDHDTNNAYRAVPIMVGGVIQPAGPLYSGQNAQPPGVAPILPAEGVLRVRNYLIGGGALQNVEYLPHTNPAIDIKLTVTETPLSGQIPDFAGLGTLDGVFSGLLPGIDPKPVMDVNRPASALSPAAYRSANGRLNVYFARNAKEGGVTGDIGQTGAGSPFRLFHTHMNWDATLGTFVASHPGVPLADPASNEAKWFTTNKEIIVTLDSKVVATDSNVYPSVLQVDSKSPTATLMWVNSRLQTGTLPQDTIMWCRLDANGEPIGAPRSLLPLNNNRPDSTFRRFGPRAAFDVRRRTGFVFYYGGPAGKTGIYYTPYFSNSADGQPDGSGGIRGSNDLPLTLPQAIVTASDPNATIRRLQTPDHSGVPLSFALVDSTAAPLIVDVTYTGVMRNTQTPDLFMSRYYVQRTQNSFAATLAPIVLPQIDRERLVQVGRELAWRSRHIGWYVRYNNATASVENLRVSVLQPNGTPRYTTQDNTWQYDSNSRRWAQVIRRTGGVLYVYVDTDTGEIRFRGADEPQSTDTVVALYQPTAYRLTPDSAGDSGGFVTMDTRILPASPTTPGSVVRRQTPLISNGVLTGVGRQWVLWGKSAQPSRPAHLYYAARRVGIDLKSVDTANPLQRSETIALSPALNASGNLQAQVPLASVNVVGVGPVPFDVDFVTGRVFVDAYYEGMVIQVTYTATQGPVASNRSAVATGRLGYIEELAPTDTYSMGLQVPMNRSINESQPYGFVDLYNYDPTQPDLLLPMSAARVPSYTLDPTLQPGRFWMFWTSSRPRTGRVPFGGNLVPVPNGFELFYQTLAPNFESLTYTPFGQ